MLGSVEVAAPAAIKPPADSVCCMQLNTVTQNTHAQAKLWKHSRSFQDSVWGRVQPRVQNSTACYQCTNNELCEYQCTAKCKCCCLQWGPAPIQSAAAAHKANSCHNVGRHPLALGHSKIVQHLPKKNTQSSLNAGQRRPLSASWRVKCLAGHHYTGAPPGTSSRHAKRRSQVDHKLDAWSCAAWVQE